MSKLVVHVILPEMSEGSYEASVLARSLEAFRRQMHPFDILLHQSDLAYEKAKNPLREHEAPICSATQPVALPGEITVEKDPFH